MDATAEQSFVFANKAQLAAALGLVLIPAPTPVHACTDGDIVADVEDGGRGIAAAMLLRAGISHDHAKIEALAVSLRLMLGP